MIEKAGVLLGVQYFEQRGCGIALIRSTYLVDLVEHDDRIRDAGFANRLNELAGHGADVSTPEGQRAILDACPNPDILVNNNGGPPFKDFRELDREAMLAGVTMNMITPIELIQSVIDGMVERGFGRIVNITSISVKMPIPGLDLSSAARAGLTSFLAGVVPKVAEHNVTINNILPGFFLTDRHSAALKQAMEERGMSREEAIAERAEIVPAKRFGDPAEFGEACAFLCSVQAGYITGQNLLLDGGVFESAF